MKHENIIDSLYLAASELKGRKRQDHSLGFLKGHHIYIKASGPEDISTETIPSSGLRFLSFPI